MKKTVMITLCALLFAACNLQQKTEKQENENVMKREDTLTKILPTEIPGNAIDMIANEWMLITAGDEETYNTMTASWGTLGQLWGKNVSTCYIRPERFTYEFIEKNDCYTLCFFDEEYREALQYCGTKSGRDHLDKNKAEVAGLTPACTENGSVYFKEASLVLECKKLYAEQFRPECFINDDVLKSIYDESKGIHKAYVGEIVNCWIRKETIAKK
jgi:flavin reductase (DIM6/NTAB) family NADH-FMN oxidoreductase RutF